MEETNGKDKQPSERKEGSDSQNTQMDTSQNIFLDSPVYDDLWNDDDKSSKKDDDEEIIDLDSSPKPAHVKERSPSKPKVDEIYVVSSESQLQDGCDNEIAAIIGKAEALAEVNKCLSPFAVKSLQPIRSSPRKLTKRSNSCTTCCENPKSKMVKIRSNSTELDRYSPAKFNPKKLRVFDSVLNSHTKVQSVDEIQLSSGFINGIIEETENDVDNSQSFVLQMSPTSESVILNTDKEVPDLREKCSSEPVVAADRNEVLTFQKPNIAHSLGYNYSDHSANSQTVRPELLVPPKESSADFNSPVEKPLSVSSKLIQKLSNGNSSTPTDTNTQMNTPSSQDTITPQMISSLAKNTDLNHISANTTPSTISPLQNGHHNSFPMNTPKDPVFDIHIGHDEDGEFLSMYVARMDVEQGLDMCKEFQRMSKRFTIDPYLGDVSKSNSPSSVTSTGVYNIQNRTSFASTVSSSSSNASSNRTSDGAFIIPQAPTKNGLVPGITKIKGFKALVSKIIDIFSHISHDSLNINLTSFEEKISTSVQVSPANLSDATQTAVSPEEISRSDRVTPKSSLKKSRGRPKRPLASKTKRAILPTQLEESEEMDATKPDVMKDNEQDSANLLSKPVVGSLNGTTIKTPRSVSKLKKNELISRSPTPLDVSSSTAETYSPGTLVLAKWIDKRFYSGKVKVALTPSKYVIDFDDGHTKTLLTDFIIFGNMKELPLNSQSVYALVDEDQNYEPGLVLGIDYNDHGTVTYRVTTDGDALVSVTASELYLTEDQAESLIDVGLPKSPSSNPSTPRRRGNRELDLDNIIHGPRSARSARDKNKLSQCSPRSPKAGTSGIKFKTQTPTSTKKLRHLSESSEMSEGSNSGFNTNVMLNRVDEVAGVEPEFQKTPKKVDGLKACPLQLKGVAKQKMGKKNWKSTKFEDTDEMKDSLGPIPAKNSKLFAGMHFLLTCSDQPVKPKKDKDTRAYSSEEDGESSARTDAEDLGFTSQPFNKERLKEQLETGGGTVYSYFDDIPVSKYNSTRLIAPKPCLTAKYIKCLAADIKCVSHGWVIMCCVQNALVDFDSYVLPSGWSITKERFLDFVPSSGKRNTNIFKNKLILICNENESFVKFWDRVCSLVGANTKVLNEDNDEISGALAVVTDWDCPHEIQNKANHENIPLVSTTWVVQCLIENRLCPPKGHVKYSFMYMEPE